MLHRPTQSSDGSLQLNAIHWKLQHYRIMNYFLGLDTETDNS